MSTLRCVHTVSKFVEVDENFKFLVQEDLSHELCKRLMGIISSGEAYCIKLEPMSITEDLMKMNMQYCMNLKMKQVVLCKDCANRKENKFCLEHMRYEDDYGFCSHCEPKEREGE